MTLYVEIEKNKNNFDGDSLAYDSNEEYDNLYLYNTVERENNDYHSDDKNDTGYSDESKNDSGYIKISQPATNWS